MTTQYRASELSCLNPNHTLNLNRLTSSAGYSSGSSLSFDREACVGPMKDLLLGGQQTEIYRGWDHCLVFSQRIAGLDLH